MVKFKQEAVEFVKEVGSISIDIFKANFTEYCQKTIKGIDQSFEKKIDRSLLRLICNLLENSLDKKNIVDEKVNKKDLVIDIYLLFKPQANNAQDKIILNELIEDLHNTGQIKKVSTKRYLKKTLSSSLKKLVSWL
jgi:hypothetical protein